MKTVSIIMISFFCFILISCEKDAVIQPKDFPFVITKDASQIDSTGVTFNAEILDYGKEQIIDYGFNWYTDESNFTYSIIKDENNPSNFKKRISNDLKKGFQYTFQAYIKTPDKIILANKIYFESKGSIAPVITDFYPKQGYDGAQVTITGSNFSFNQNNNIVLINGLKAQVVKSTAESIIFIVPETGFHGSVDIQVQVGDNTVTAKDKYNIIGPDISGISAEKGFSGDTISVAGINLVMNNEITELYWGSIKMTIVDSSETRIDAIIPPTDELFLARNNDINVFVGDKKASNSLKFTILPAWKSESNFPYILSLNYQTFTYENEGYILDPEENKIFKHNPEFNNWSIVSTKSIPGSIFNSLCIPLNNFIYKAGGYDYTPNFTVSRKLWKFNIETNEWSQLQDLPFGFTKAIYFVKNKSVHIVTDTQEHWKCDFENGVFKKLARSPVILDRPYEQPFAQIFISNNRIFMVAYGRTFEYIYNHDYWEEKARYPIRAEGDAYRLKGVAYNNKGYILDFLRKEMFSYDVVADKWNLVSLLPPLPDTGTVGTKFIVWSTSQKLYITGANEINSNIFSYKNHL